MTTTETTAKTCTACNLTKSVSDFYKGDCWCKPCCKAQAAERKAAQDRALRGNTFGVEIETIGLSREAAAKAVAAVFSGRAERRGGYYDKWVAVMADGREWTAMSDASISGGNSGQNAEIVSPICKYEDIELVQEVVRALRAAGARVDSSCGIHVHVGAEMLGPAGCARLVKIVHAAEPALRPALSILPHRNHWCRPLSESTVTLMRRGIRTADDLARAWYGTSDNGFYRREHYNRTRYHGLNLHSVFYRGTVEFRWFNGTLHAGKVKSYIQLCLALAAKAASEQGVKCPKFENNAASMAKAFNWLRLTGKEFETARLHLSATYRTGGE